MHIRIKDTFYLFIFWTEGRQSRRDRDRKRAGPPSVGQKLMCLRQVDIHNFKPLALQCRDWSAPLRDVTVHFSNTHDVPGTVLGTGNSEMNKL